MAGALQAIGRNAAIIATALLDAALPPRCPSCGAMVDRQGSLCPACWANLRFIAAPSCERCAVPLPQGPAGILVCPECIVSPPVFSRARAALRYDPASAPMILAMKHRGRLQAVEALATWMTRAGADLVLSADALVPVPLHRWRMLKRGFNQSALLAEAIGRRTGVPTRNQALVRRRSTRTQQGLSGTERVRNMGDTVFEVPAGGRRFVEGRRLVLVDDVFTTGSTLSACAAVLKQSGAAAVDVLVLARVVRDGSVTISSMIL